MLPAHRMMQALVRLALMASLAALLLMAAILPARAQAPAPPPAAEILAVDTANFPEVAVEVRLQGIQAQDALRAELLEDGVPQVLIGAPSEIARNPVNLGILLDISSQSYRETYDAPFTAWLTALLDQAKLAPYQDRLALFTPDGTGANLRSDFGDVLLEQDRWEGFWALDHNRVLNLALNENFNSVAPQTTALTRLIRSAIDNFPDEAAASNQLIVFTGSVDKAGADNFDELEAACAAGEVQVHAVMVSPEETTNRSRMQAIVDRCNGVLVDLADVPGNADPLIRTIVEGWQQQLDLQLRYRTRQPQPRLVALRVPLPGGTSLEASRELELAAPPAPPEVSVGLPAGTTELAAGAPARIDLAWALGNYPSRTIAISYTVKPVQTAWTAVALPAGTGGQAAISVEIPASALQAGINLVEVRAGDELGLQSVDSTQLVVAQNSGAPAAPPVVEPPETGIDDDAGAGDESSPVVSWEVLLGLALFAGAGALGYLFWRAPSAPHLVAPADGTTVSENDAVTLRWQMPRGATDSRVEVTTPTGGVPELGQWQQTQVLAIGSVDLDTTWRVQARNRFGREGRWSGTWKILSNNITKPAGAQALGPFARLVRQSAQRELPEAIPLVDDKGRPREVVAVGRSRKFADKDALLIDDAQTVSRTHCRIRFHQEGYKIHDEGSSAGTFVNDEKVDWSGRLLYNGDLIKLGAAVYCFEKPDHSKEEGTEPVRQTEPSEGNLDPDRTQSMAR